MRVLWSDQAITDLWEIRDYIAEESEDSAVRTVKRLFERECQLADSHALDVLYPSTSTWGCENCWKAAIASSLDQEGRSLDRGNCSRLSPVGVDTEVRPT